jgi:hypothetical protein
MAASPGTTRVKTRSPPRNWNGCSNLNRTSITLLTALSPRAVRRGYARSDTTRRLAVVMSREHVLFVLCILIVKIVKGLKWYLGGRPYEEDLHSLFFNDERSFYSV